ncbi:interleukin 17 [Brachionus plicatilis]|uniref:Interleukin 17 n=1 Tax=Brachionus plicatilis TaxID=10195 RepID=A0A3M7QXT7_BRAPC|nr:interleukin 17 [Brachionus plicatilis]
MCSVYYVILHIISHFIILKSSPIDSSHEQLIFREIKKEIDSYGFDQNFDFLNHFNSKYGDSISKKKTNAYNIFEYLLNTNPKRINSKSCLNPNQEYLELLYSEYSIFFRKQEELLVKLESPSKNEKYLTETDDSQCNINERNTTTINKRSICPWKYKLNIRFDRFPPYRAEAKCSCSYCNFIGNNILPINMYGCLPVLKPIPVLVKQDECDKDGYYIWKPDIDYVNMACTCGFVQNFISHGKR